jgi:predicted dehydrogenase
MCWLLGEIETLSAQVSTQVTEWTAAETAERVAATAPDNVGILVRLRSGVVGTVQLSNTAVDGGAFRLEMYGTEGKLVLTADGMLGNALFRLFAARKGECERELSVPERFISVTGLPLGSPAYNVARLFECFAAAIRTGQKLGPSFADAVRVHQLLEAIDRSSTTRSWVAF